MRASRGAKPQAAEETIRTIHGEDVPVTKLAHIAPDLRIFAIRAATLKLDPNNAREHGKRDIESTAQSLRGFGQQELLQFEPETRIVGVGNGRLAGATRLLEWEYIAARPTNLTKQQFKAFALAHNRTAELSTWNPERVAEQLKELHDAAADGLAELESLSLESMGLGEVDLEEIQDEAERKTREKQTAVADKTVKSVEGEIHQVVLTCGSSKHQGKLLAAFEKKDMKALAKLLNGIDVRSRTA